MPIIRILGSDIEFDNSSVIHFSEGLLGMPTLQKMVLINHEEVAPMMWLASLDDDQAIFLVINPYEVLPDYKPSMVDEIKAKLSMDPKEDMLILAIVHIHQEWNKSSVNLRAPLFISPSKMCGMQVILHDSPYRADEPIPIAQAA